MSSRLPELIDPFHLADKGRRFDGTIALSKMKRVASLLAGGEDGSVQVEVQFAQDSVGQAVITGRVKSDFQLLCQRCLEPMDYSVDTAFTLGVVSTLAQAAKLPESYEPLVAEEVPLSLTEIVEDEILLALPAVALHDPAHCAVRQKQVLSDESAVNGEISVAKGKFHGTCIGNGNSGYSSSSCGSHDELEKVSGLDEKKENPFAVLAELKKEFK